MADKPIPREQPRSHVTGPIPLLGRGGRRGPTEEDMAHAEAQDWLAELLRGCLIEHMGDGPSSGGRHLPLAGIGAHVDHVEGALDVRASVGEFSFVIRVEPADRP